MIRFLRQIFAGAAPPDSNADALGVDHDDPLKRRGITIENRNRPPPPGVIAVESEAAISAIFRRDCMRQEAEFLSQGMQSYGRPNIGTTSGLSYIHITRK
jgi:hypothetical protein